MAEYVTSEDLGEVESIQAADDTDAGLPRVGVHVGRGPHVEIDIEDPSSPGWTCHTFDVLEHPDRPEWAYQIRDGLEERLTGTVPESMITTLQTRAPLCADWCGLSDSWIGDAVPVDASRAAFASDAVVPEFADTRLRRVSFSASGYTAPVESDRNRSVTAAGGSTGELIWWDNDVRLWLVLGDTVSDTFSETDAVAVDGGTGAGTGSGSEQGWLHERSDPVLTSLELTVAGTAVYGTYTDADGLKAALDGGTYSSGVISGLSGSAGDFDVSFSGTYSGDAVTGTITVARNAAGSANEDREWSALRGPAVLPTGTHYYVDSRSGDDANAGSGAIAPYATIGALGTLSANDTVHLARGSRWREMLYADQDGVTVRAYGVGPRPVLEASELAGTWVQEDGYTNVWKRAGWAPEHDNANGGSTYVPLKNGVAMERIGRTALPLSTDLAALDSTPGACVVPESSGSGAYDIYIYAASDPNSDENVYEIPSRECGLWLDGDGSRAYHLHGRANAGDNGAIRLPKNDSVQWDCVSEWGPVHNFIQGSGGHIQHCMALFAAPRWNGGATYGGAACVTYVPTGSGSDTAAYTDVAVIQYRRSDLERISSAFTSHTSGGADIAQIDYDQIFISGFGGGIGGVQTSNATVSRLFYERGGGIGQPNVPVGGIVSSLTRSRIYGHVAGYELTSGFFRPDADTAASQNLMTCGDTGSERTMIDPAAALTIEKNTFHCGSALNQAVNDSGSGASLATNRNNVFWRAKMLMNGALADIAPGASDVNQAYPNNAIYWIRRAGSTQRLTWYTLNASVSWPNINTDLDQQSAFAPTANQPTWETEKDATRPVYASKSDGYNAGHSTFQRILTFEASGYTAAVAGDVGKLVTGGTTGDVGMLSDYDNDGRTWTVTPLTTSDTFALAESVSILEAYNEQGDGTGAGTTTGASDFIPGFEFSFIDDQPTGFFADAFVKSIM